MHKNPIASDLNQSHDFGGWLKSWKNKKKQKNKNKYASQAPPTG